MYSVDIKLPPFPRGFHLVTNEISSQLGDLPKIGTVHLLLMHTSAGLTLNENADPTVRFDFESFMNKFVPESRNFEHILEGLDDMPAHIKSSLFGTQITIPIRNGVFALGTWQGIYLCEFRNRGGVRKILATVSN